MKRIISVCMAICLALASSACNLIVKDSSDEQYDYPVTVGNTVFEQAPENVVVLSDNLADIIIACGYEGKLGGRSDSCFQKEIAILNSVGTPDSPDYSKLLGINTKLVLADESFDSEYKTTLQEMGINVLVIKPAVNESEIKTLYGNIASIFGGSYTGKMKAMDIETQIKTQLDDIKNEIYDGDVVSTVCYIYSVEGDHCRVAYGNDYTAQLFEYAHLTNISTDSDCENGNIGFDTLLTANPETIFCNEGVAEQIKSNPDLNNLSAVTNKRIYTLPERYLFLQGKTRITTVDYLAAKTHDYYVPKTEWPESFSTEAETETEEYVPPFEPKENIFYTVGESYSQISYIEERLIQLGYLEGEADNAFTQETADAVAVFQSNNGLEVTGIADYNTLIVLLSNEAAANS